MKSVDKVMKSINRLKKFKLRHSHIGLTPLNTIAPNVHFYWFCNFTFTKCCPNWNNFLALGLTIEI